MGKEERAEMFFELETVNKELKEIKWKINQFCSLIGNLNFVFKGEGWSQALGFLQKPENKSLLNLEDLSSLLQKLLDFEAKKVDLEKKLGSKVTME